MLIKSVKSSTGYPAKINGCRTQSPYRNTFPDKTFKNFQWSVRYIDISIRKACNKTSFYHFCFFAYMNRFVIQCGAFSFFCKKEFIEMGIKNSRHDNLAVMFDANGNAIQWNTVSKIYSAINRINNPFVTGILDDFSGFFGQNIMIRKL